MRVLLVHDNEMGINPLRMELERQGCEVAESNGADGLQMAKELRPALVICGLSVASGGFRLLLGVRVDPLLRATGFIFCTLAPIGKRDEQLAMALGADGVISIPADPEDLRTTLQPFMEMFGPANSVGAPLPCDRFEYLFAACREIMSRLEERSAELDEARTDLGECEKRYRRLLGSVNDYIYTVWVDKGHPLSTSHGPGCVAVTGYSPEELKEDPGLWFRMIHEDDREMVREMISLLYSRNTTPLPYQHRIIHKDGRVRWIRNTYVPRYNREGHLVAYDGQISDITEYKRLEEQFRHAQKMEAVGVLAGGIAHDFNNILTAMIGYGDILQRQLAHDHAARSNVDQILAAAERAANLVHGLLAFSRKQVMNPRPIDLNRNIRNVEKLLSRLITEDIELRVALAQEETGIMADPGQIDQILMNLVTNARDAMPKGGVLAIETLIMDMDLDFIKEHGFGAQGRYVLVSISDTGMGMDEQARLRIFEPFYTTKPMGKGTGLGLSIVYGIVKQHNGFIEIQSEPGEGTTFMIYFPLIEEKGRDISGSARQPAIGGNQTILIADDDMQVRTVVNIILSKSGYTVIEAEDGEAAVQLFRTNPDKIDLLVLDIVMPRKNGLDAYEEIRKIRQDMKAIFISGYTADVIDQKGVGYEDLNIVAKPISPNDLLLKIRDTLMN